MTTPDPSERPPVVLLGSPRSGTTLLGHVFASHHDVYYANEPRLLWRYGNDRRSDSLQREHATPDVVSHIRAAFDQRVRESGRSILVEKTPANTLRIPFVDAVLPQARFIHIVRDGRECVAAIHQKWLTKATGVASPQQRQRLRRRLAEASPRQVLHYAPELARRLVERDRPALWGPRPPGLSEMARDLPLLDVCAHQWRWCVESVLRDGHVLGDRLVTVRLEELDLDTIEELARFAQMPAAGLGGMMEEFRSRFRSDLTAGRFDRLNRAEQERITQIIGPTIRELGQR